MSHRRGAPSVNKECVVRRKWYAEAQEKEFKGNDSSSSDDEAQVVHVTEEEISAAAGRKTGEEKHDNEVLDDAKETKKVSSRPPSTFTNFASMLGAESSNRMERIRTADKIDKDARLELDRAIPEFLPKDLDNCLHKISNPADSRAILICCGGFGDNGRMFQEYGAFFEVKGVQLISFTFPGKLHRVGEDFLPSVLDYMDWVVAALLHHGFMIRLEKNKRQGVLPTMPPITVFGHDFGSTVAFELIRMLKKSESVYMPIHHFIASACRPPEVLSEFNKNDKSRKFSKESAETLMKRYLDLGFCPTHMSKRGEERTDILRVFLSCFRAEYKALESYEFKRSMGKQGPPLECNVTVLGGAEDVFAGSEIVLQKWRDATSGDCFVHVFDNAGHFYWKHSELYEDQFLEFIMDKLFVREELPFDDSFLEVARSVSLDESV